MPGHAVEAIANEFLRRAAHEQRHLTNMQLQKLPYIAHGWSLALTGKELVEDQPKAFPYGPVYPSLYDALKRYGSGRVTNLICENDAASIYFGGPPGDPIKANLTPEEQELIDAVWNAYKGFHAFKLSELTHQANSPWTQISQNKGLYSPIPNDVIRAHYADLAKQRQAAR